MKQVPQDQTYKYGIGQMDKQYLMDIVEKPSIENAPSNKAVFTPYIVHKSFLQQLSQVKPDPISGEIYPRPALKTFMENKEIIGYVTQHPLRDTGNPEARLKANNEIGNNPSLVE